MTPVSLDEPAAIAAVDRSDMLGTLAGFADMLEDARKLALAVDVGPIGAYRNIVVSALGASALGADLVRALLNDHLKIPMLINRDYGVPAFVDEDTLFIASSYSGSTEETVCALESAAERRAQLVAIASGGRLREMAHEGGYPAIVVPAGIVGRSALAYMFVSVWTLLSRLGLAAADQAHFEEAVDVVRSIAQRCAPEVPSEKNLAKQLAQRLHGNLPVIYGSQGYRGTIALRWKSQFNENAKVPAQAGAFPELNHNETAGWSGESGLDRRHSVVLLRDPRESKAIAMRVELTKEIVSERAAGVTDVWCEGSSDIAKLCSLVCVGDFVSVYLAVLSNQDPTPLPAIDRFKAELTRLQR